LLLIVKADEEVSRISDIILSWKENSWKLYLAERGFKPLWEWMGLSGTGVAHASGFCAGKRLFCLNPGILSQEKRGVY